MKKTLIGLVALALCCGLIGLASASNIDTQTVQFQIMAIDELEASGNPAMLTINLATAGSGALTPATDATTTYAITTNGTARRITGAIDTAMPANTTLEVNLTAPSGGTSAGYVSLSASAQSLVTGITQLAQSGVGIAYRFSATLAAGTLSGTRTVTLTLTN